MQWLTCDSQFHLDVSGLYCITGGTAALWVTYVRLYKRIDPQEEHSIPLIRITVDARTAFLVYSIVASILTVSIS